MIILAVLIAASVLTKTFDPARAQQTCAPAPSGMVAWLPGDDTFNLRDTVNGSFFSGSPLFGAGKVGQGFNIDDEIPNVRFGRFVQVPATVNNTLTQAMTIDAWIKPDTVTGTSQRAIVAREGNFGHRAYAFSILDGGRLQMIVYSRPSGPETFRAVVTDAAVISPGVFTHVAATFNPGTQEMKIYVNGADAVTTLLNGSANIASIYDPTGNAPGFQIGTLFDQTKAFDGIIDEFQLFNRALTQAEIQTIVAADSAGNCKPQAPCGGQIFGAASALPVNPNLVSSIIGDFNGDGIQDLAVINGSSGNSNTVAILFGNGDGTFDAAVNFPLDGVVNNRTTLRMAVGDFNGDGIDDLAIPRSPNGPGLIVVLLSNTTGTLVSGPSFTSTRRIEGINTGDFDGDGKADIVASSPFSDQAAAVLLLKGDGAGGFTQTGLFGTLQPGSSDIVVGDFNNDGKQDVVTANTIGQANGSFSVLLGDGAGGLGAAQVFPLGKRPVSIGSADLNSDGNVDLFFSGTAGCCASDDIFIYRGDGTGSFTRQFTGLTGRSGSVLSPADFNGDGKPDIAAATDVGLFAFLGSGDFIFHSTTSYPVAAGLLSNSVGDFDRDGKPDFAGANSSGNNVSVLLNTCSLTFAPVVDMSVSQSDAPDPIQVGQTVTYTLRAANNSIRPATGVVITDTCPPMSSLFRHLRIALNQTESLRAASAIWGQIRK